MENFNWELISIILNYCKKCQKNADEMSFNSDKLMTLHKDKC